MLKVFGFIYFVNADDHCLISAFSIFQLILEYFRANLVDFLRGFGIRLLHRT